MQNFHPSKWQVNKAWQTYEYENFQQADADLTKASWISAGQDGCLNHIYTKTVATQSYGLHDIYARVSGTLTGGYKMERIEPLRKEAA